MKVSVIIPTYNRAHLISETIDSIVNQTLRPAEIVIVDDGSTDNTERVVKKYANLVKYYRIENSGVCKARNVGVDKSQNEWVAFCDSDDLWHQDKLFHQVQLIKSSNEVEYCFTNFRVFSGDRWSNNTKFDECPVGFWDIKSIEIGNDLLVIKEPLYSKLLTFTPIFPSTILMNKTFYNRVGGFDENFGRKISEDFEFSLRCVQEKNTGVIKKAVVGIRKHEQNFSNGNLRGISFIIGDIQILKYSLQNHKLGQQNETLIKEQIIDRSISVAHGTFAAGEFSIFKEILKNIPLNRRSSTLWIKLALTNIFLLYRNRQKRLTQCS